MKRFTAMMRNMRIDPTRISPERSPPDPENTDAKIMRIVRRDPKTRPRMMRGCG
jgi:hypothetical protein